MRRIRLAEGELRGRLPTKMGLIASMLFFISGAALQTVLFASELPEGYQRVSFTFDISKKGFVVEEGKLDVHPDVKTLDGTKVLVKGYMYPPEKTFDIDNFILVKDNQQCCFGGQPQLEDMIQVDLQDDLLVDFRKSLVAVAGILRVKDPMTGGNLKPVFELEGTHFIKAPTQY